jgi:undecaprenyl diphosphate synthase
MSKITPLKKSSAALSSSLDYDKLPQHIAIIMDGNGRWAKERHLPRIVGHHQGSENVDTIVSFCREIGIRYVTLYAFSLENWARPKDETIALMDLLKDYLAQKREKFVKNEIRFETIGDLDRLPAEVLAEIEATKEATKNLNRMVMALALSYSARDEIVRAVNKLLKDKEQNRFQDSYISVHDFRQYLDTCAVPDPDLLIRTGRERRISNFLLWQSAYTELYFTDTLWPDFSEDCLVKAIQDYQSRERRFGKTSEQVGED